MKSSVSSFVLSALLVALFVSSSLGVPLIGSGYLPFPGAIGDPPRDTYQTVITGPGGFSGTWPGIGPNPPAQAPWIGTFIATGPTPHTPPSGPNTTGLTKYNFSPTGGYAPGILPVGTYFHFGDLDSGSSESFRLMARDVFNNVIMTPWLDEPFAATNTAVAADMPTYSFTPGVYDFNGVTLSANSLISVFLKNNTPIEYLEVTRGSTNASFILAAPSAGQVPEPGTLILMFGGISAYVCGVRRR